MGTCEKMLPLMYDGTWWTCCLDIDMDKYQCSAYYFALPLHYRRPLSKDCQAARWRSSSGQRLRWKGSDHSRCCGTGMPSVYVLTSRVPTSNFASSRGIFLKPDGLDACASSCCPMASSIGWGRMKKGPWRIVCLRTLG